MISNWQLVQVRGKCSPHANFADDGVKFSMVRRTGRGNEHMPIDYRWCRMDSTGQHPSLDHIQRISLGQFQTSSVQCIHNPLKHIFRWQHIGISHPCVTKIFPPFLLDPLDYILTWSINHTVHTNKQWSMNQDLCHQGCQHHCWFWGTVSASGSRGAGLGQGDQQLWLERGSFQRLRFKFWQWRRDDNNGFRNLLSLGV